jgi:hypothetical protein
MNEKQIFISIVGGITFAFLGGLLVIPIQWLARATDGGDDLGWGLLWVILMSVSGICGFLLTAKWARKRYPDFQP